MLVGWFVGWYSETAPGPFTFPCEGNEAQF